MGNRLKDMWGLDSPLLSFLQKIAWVFFLNILFIITSLPIITIGASTTAMYAVYFKIINEQEFSLFGDYFREWIGSFVKSTVVWLLLLVVMLVLGIDVMYVFTQMSGPFGIIMKGGTILLAVVFCVFANIVFPLISQFQLTMKELFSTAFQLIMENILLALESVVFTVVVFGGCFLIIATGFFWGLFIIFPLISFGIHGLMQSYLYRKMFGLDVREEEEDEFDEEVE